MDFIYLVSSHDNSRGMGNSHSDAILVLAVQHLHGLDGLWNRTAATDEHAIDIKGKGKAVGGREVCWADGGSWCGGGVGGTGAG
jgi:hypothetical protein